MTIQLPPYGDFRLSPLEGTTDLSGEPTSSPPIVIDARRTVTDVDRIVEMVDILGRATLSSPDIGELADGADRISSAIGFAIGTDLSTSSAELTDFPNHYLAETDDDRRLLERFGVDRACLLLLASTGVEVADHSPVDAGLIKELAQRGAVTIYREALRMETNVGQFRELWRTLEFAFQAHGPKLVELLAAFPPVAELGFDRTELEAIRVLRGKISHAASRAGSAQTAQSGAEVVERIGRLWCLVDRVVLTKRDASRSLDVDELRPLKAFVDRDGRVQLSPSIANPEEWLEGHGISRARRFR
ncbi:MAG TPA: hypothetical protein VHW67_13845 [Solirubrobacteraceae bacterium]|nr:hypothetical protein [Solirubrobacteraceae bacterium]